MDSNQRSKSRFPGTWKGVAILLSVLLVGGTVAGCSGTEDTAEAEPADTERPGEANPAVLVFSKTEGYRHAAIPEGIRALRRMGREEGFAVRATEDATVFTEDTLAQYDAVVFLNTSGDVLNEAQQQALRAYMQTGGGYAGVHAAADTESDWPWYRRLVGAYFEDHPSNPNVRTATVRVADRSHPSTRGLPEAWERTDEWYNYRSNPRDSVDVLATVDESTYEGGTMGADHPIAWKHVYEGNGRAWYTGGGHTKASYTEDRFLQHLRGGILWVAGASVEGEG